MTRQAYEYHGWIIELNPKPGPDRRYDWDFVHPDFDGENGMVGWASSPEDAERQIEEWEEENEQIIPASSNSL